MRTGRASLAGIGLALLLLPSLGAGSASAAFTTVLVPDGTLMITGDDQGDDITLNCNGPPPGELTVGFQQQPSGGPIMCSPIERIQANLGGGPDLLNMGELLFAERLGSFSGVTVDAGPGDDNVLTVQGQPSSVSGITFDPDTVAFLGPGADLFSGGLGADIVSGGPRSDLIRTSNGLNVVRGEAGGDIVIGGNDADRILGQSGTDGIDGGPGNDLLTGGTGNDRIIGDLGRDRIRGGPGRNQLFQEGKGLSIHSLF